jgi:cytochrome c-type biogenesis protein CcmE
MSTKTAKIGLTGLVLVLAFAGLLYSTMSESLEYYKKVDEVMVNPAEWKGKALQLHGYAKGVSRKPETLDYRFDIESNGKVVRAFYTGVTPDTFKEDSEVVVKGRLADDNTFHATEIIAKCPSKYDPAAAPAVTSGTE